MAELSLSPALRWGATATASSYCRCTKLRAIPESTRLDAPRMASGQTAKLTGGVDPTSMHFHLDFSALGLASCRQIWLTLAPGDALRFEQPVHGGIRLFQFFRDRLQPLRHHRVQHLHLRAVRRRHFRQRSRRRWRRWSMRALIRTRRLRRMAAMYSHRAHQQRRERCLLGVGRQRVRERSSSRACVRWWPSPPWNSRWSFRTGPSQIQAASRR